MLLYHLVCPAKYRRKVFTAQVEETLKATCEEISQRYEIEFVEIGADEDHVHFLIQSVPRISPSQIVQVVKSITAREIFSKHREVKKKLWGGELWTSGYYINTVGQYANESVIQNYVKEQGRSYKPIHRNQLNLFE